MRSFAPFMSAVIAVLLVPAAQAQRQPTTSLSLSSMRVVYGGTVILSGHVSNRAVGTTISIRGGVRPLDYRLAARKVRVDKLPLVGDRAAAMWTSTAAAGVPAGEPASPTMGCKTQKPQRAVSKSPLGDAVTSNSSVPSKPNCR